MGFLQPLARLFQVLPYQNCNPLQPDTMLVQLDRQLTWHWYCLLRLAVYHYSMPELDRLNSREMSLYYQLDIHNTIAIQQYIVQVAFYSE